jgi:UDP-2,4-diacetamido-2,4,6-trideoxy-beta-L-altropyranose hydrolase
MAGLKILFRADADPVMGTGHIMRSLALAQALRDLGHDCHMGCAAVPRALAARLAAEEINLHRLENSLGQGGVGAAKRDAEQTLYIASEIGAAGLVVDGYHFDADWRHTLYRRAKATGRTVLALIDDADGPVAHADLVLNPASRAAAPPPTCLLGTRFVLLRRDIREAIEQAPPLAARRHILVSFGGSDPKALTLPVTTALAQLLRRDGLLADRVSLSVVLGGAVEGADGVAAALAALGSGVEIHRDVREMGPLISQAGLAISAGGGTLGELAALAVPSLVVPVADNQIAGSRLATEAGWCLSMAGDAMNSAAMAAKAHQLWRDLATRETMARKARGLIDGQGAIRAAQALVDVATHSLNI